MKPLASFKIRPGKEPNYWQVYIFNNKADMRRMFKKLDMTDEDDRFGAVVMPQMRIKFPKKGKGSKKGIVHPSLGYVLFSKTQLRAEEIAHEAVHMATNYLRIMNPKSLVLSDECDDNEEDLAYAVGHCANALVKGLYRTKVW